MTDELTIICQNLGLPEIKLQEIEKLNFLPLPPRMQDRAGNKSHHLTVLGLAERDTVKNKTYWWVICDCPNHTILKIRSDNLTNRQSCGCQKKQGNFAYRNLQGQKFNRLTVLEKTDKRSANGRVIWRCRCDCGTICEVESSSLTSNNTQSCGCLKRENAHFAVTEKQNLVGRRFGHLKVIEETSQREFGRIVWKCQCDCGNICFVNTTKLTQGNNISCGCKTTSLGAARITALLVDNKIPFIKEYTLKDLDNQRIDFVILNDDNNIKRFIEFDGEQHYRSTGGWNTPESLEKRRIRDKQKNEYALSHNIPLVRIPYWERDNITLDMLLGDKYLVK